MVGALMATEGLKVLLGRGETLKGRLWGMDLLRMRVREKSVVRRPDCPACGKTPLTRKA
jgi:adenylyltransferase/sulfurtransferase